MKKLFIIIIFYLTSFFSNGQNIATKIDLSTYCPYLKHQFKATCYAYAFAYTALTISYCIKNNITDPIEVNNNAFSPGFIASIHRIQTNLNFKCGYNGSYDVDIAIFKQYGCPLLNDFKFDCTTEITSEAKRKATQIRLKDFEYIQKQQDNSSEAVLKIKEILSKKLPVLIALNMTDDFAIIDSSCDTSLPILINGKKSKTAHDICIIGYDDDVTSKYFGRFLIKNNFEGWGNKKNMAWVRYQDMMYMITDAMYFTIE